MFRGRWQEVGDLEFTRLLVVAGGGINIAATRRVGFDVGYRYHRIFADDPSITTIWCTSQ